MESCIFIGLGSNLASPSHGPPPLVLSAAVERLTGPDLVVIQRSRWYWSKPVPASDQPLFANGVVRVATAIPPQALLARLHAIESAFGRVRAEQRNQARILDLDLLSYGEVVTAPACDLMLPHPRLHERAFVLKPLVEVAADWRHPISGRTASQMLAALGQTQWAEPIGQDQAAGPS